jgi:copper transport protein
MTERLAAIRLTFNERLEAPFTKVTLSAANGSIALRPVQIHPDSPNVAIAEIVGELPAGDYQVSWEVVGRDGHAVRGDFDFVMLRDPTANTVDPNPNPTSANLPPEHHPDPAQPQTQFSASSLPFAVLRGLSYVAMIVAIGAVAFRAVLSLATNRTPAIHKVTENAAKRTARIGTYAVALLLVCAVGRLVAQSYALHGAANVFSTEMVGTMLTRTAWGRGWLLHVAAASVMLWGFQLSRKRVLGWYVCGGSAFLLALSMAMSGHAAAVSGLYVLPLMADSFHVLGASGWLGSLSLLLGAGLPAAARSGDAAGDDAVGVLVNAFSPIALACAALVVMTGLFAAWVQLNGLHQLWQSSYGRMLVLKLVLLTGVFATGAYNWRRVRPALGNDVGTRRLTSSARSELLIGLLVLSATAVLVALPTPQ